MRCPLESAHVYQDVIYNAYHYTMYDPGTWSYHYPRPAVCIVLGVASAGFEGEAVIAGLVGEDVGASALYGLAFTVTCIGATALDGQACAANHNAEACLGTSFGFIGSIGGGAGFVGDVGVVAKWWEAESITNGVLQGVSIGGLITGIAGSLADTTYTIANASQPCS